MQDSFYNMTLNMYFICDFVVKHSFFQPITLGVLSPTYVVSEG